MNARLNRIAGIVEELITLGYKGPCGKLSAQGVVDYARQLSERRQQGTVLFAQHHTRSTEVHIDRRYLRDPLTFDSVFDQVGFEGTLLVVTCNATQDVLNRAQKSINLVTELARLLNEEFP